MSPENSDKTMPFWVVLIVIVGSILLAMVAVIILKNPKKQQQFNENPDLREFVLIKTVNPFDSKMLQKKKSKSWSN